MDKRPQSPPLLPASLRDVSVAINGTEILRNINLELAQDARLVVIGANGAGKSTLLRLLHGLISPSSGQAINADGAPLSDSSLRQRDAMLFQRPVLLRRSALDNVRFGNDHATEQDALRALTRVGLAHVASRPARTLSGGEQQRVALARALLREPDVLYLDEPTASIDPRSTAEIEKLLIEIADTGVAIVMTTHNLAQAKRIGKHIVYVHEGKILEVTLASTFFSQPRTLEGQQFLEGEKI
jgi:tungstate transport system ATP-binding protein